MNGTTARAAVMQHTENQADRPSRCNARICCAAQEVSPQCQVAADRRCCEEAPQLDEMGMGCMAVGIGVMYWCAMLCSPML